MENTLSSELRDNNIKEYVLEQADDQTLVEHDKITSDEFTTVDHVKKNKTRKSN